MSKVLIVGWDGATFDVIQPLLAEGQLPNLARFVQQGAWGTLRSIVPPVTPGAWTSFFTGKNPGKHGIYDFQDLDPATYQFKPVRTDRHREKTLWQLLGEQGKRSLIFDVPYTYPPQPLNGWMLTGYGTPRTPDTVFTFPPNLTDLLPPDLREEIRIAQPTHRFDRSPAFIAEWEQIMAGRKKLLHHLITQEAWDLFMVVFSITDNLAHVFWTYYDPAHPNYHKPEGPAYREAFLNAYRLSDDLLGDLMTAAGPDTTTVILSDHGFG
ncbi:MAG TPA: alkaline phosphatase family protein, partial [Anaerolineales bacterium]|nr:alkaline phosphatase family protein [Anaerolineales bacterium]